MNTKELIIRPSQVEDVEKIAVIEEKCFPAAEAASLKSFVERFITFPECFFVAELQGKVVGYINGCVTDKPELPDELYHNAALHEPDGPWQTVFGIAVLPEFQHQGIAMAMMNYFKETVKERGKEGIVLTCKDHKRGFYENLGFCCRGISESSHGGAKWNDMVLKFAS